MRSYEVARGICSFLEFLGWALVVIGGIVAVVLASNVSQYARPEASLLAMLPGLGLSLVGFVFVGAVQGWRASVDSAEYGQQMLKIAREQLEVSRQGFKGGAAEVKGFSALKQSREENPSASFSDTKVEKVPEQDKKADVQTQIEAQPMSQKERLELGLEDGELTHNGKSIQVKEGRFLAENVTFSSLEAAQLHIEKLIAKAKSVEKK